jgi:hypothetical protein
MNVNLGLMYASEYATQAQYRFDKERYRHIVFGEPSTRVAENNSRFIANLRVEKSMNNDKFKVYIFGNDILNSTFVAQTQPIYNVTLSQIGGMYGMGVNYTF